MKCTMTSRALVSCLLMGLLQPCVAEPTKAVLIQPCREAIEKSAPIKRECVAAAIAENAFLENTRHTIRKYWISPMQHTVTRWYFMILLGDEKSPPPPGGHYMVSVDRGTGKTEITPGE